MAAEYLHAPDAVGVEATAKTSSTKVSRLHDLLAFGKADSAGNPTGWNEVHADELTWIRKRRTALGGRADDGDAHEVQLSALSPSGGGIRSAAFALGVIQALATKKLLEHFDYLSTVSGGGSSDVDKGAQWVH